MLWHQYQFTLRVSSTYYLLVFINCALSLFICFPVPFLSSCTASLLLYKHDGDGVSLLCPWWIWHLTPVMAPQLHSPFFCASYGNVQLIFFLVRRTVCTKGGKVGVTLDRPVSKWFFLSLCSWYFHDTLCSSCLARSRPVGYSESKPSLWHPVVCV